MRIYVYTYPYMRIYIYIYMQAADVQAELQTYLNSKNINSLFISIVERLLIEKPENPIAFMIEYLHKQYPEEAKAALGMLGKGSKGMLSTLEIKVEFTERVFLNIYNNQ
jgi:hypothetical protein